MPAASARVVHFAYDTLPRVLAPGQPDPERVDLRMPFRIESFPSDRLRVVSWRFLVQVDGRPWTVPSSARRITREVVDLLRRQVSDRGQFHFDRVPPYLDMADRMAPGVQYLEGSVPGVPRGARVDYRLEVTLGREQQPAFTISSRSYSTYATCPVFGRDDITRIHIPEPGRALAAWALYRRREPGFEHVRVDVVSLEADPEARSTRPDLADLVLVLGGRMIDLRDPELPVLPLVDTAADAVTISVPEADGPVGAVTVRYRGARRGDRWRPRRRCTPAGPGSCSSTSRSRGSTTTSPPPTSPSAHDPVPRTYTQVTMRDEGARFSSRPGSMEDSTGDGYAFTLEAHRRYGIKQMWAMNGGLLDLLAHDCPDELAQMHDDMAAGLLEPVVAGFGAHRLPYYRADDQLRRHHRGRRGDGDLLGAAPRAGLLPGLADRHRPGQRGRRAAPRPACDYLVVDAGESENGAGEAARHPAGHAGRR